MLIFHGHTRQNTLESVLSRLKARRLCAAPPAVVAIPNYKLCNSGMRTALSHLNIPEDSWAILRHTMIPMCKIGVKGSFMFSRGSCDICDAVASPSFLGLPNRAAVDFGRLFSIRLIRGGVCRPASITVVPIPSYAAPICVTVL